MLSRDVFKKYMQQVQQTIDKDDKLSEAIERAGVDSRVMMLYGPEVQTMVELISKLMGQDSDDYDNVINYFVYDLDFGKDYKEGCFTEADGVTSIDISTVDKLYDYLILTYFKGN